MPTAAEFTVSQRNPLVSGHTVDGRPVLPGMSYVDMMLQFMARTGHRWTDLELRDLTIEAPLAVDPGAGVAVRVEARPAAPDVWRVTVSGAGAGARAGHAEVVVYARAEMHRTGPPVFHDRLGPATGRAAAGGATNLDVGYEQCRRAGIVHSGVMRARGKVHRLDDALVLDLALGPRATPDAAEFLVHPVLLDAGAIAAVLLPAEPSGDRSGAPEAGPGLYLPFCIRSFRATGPLTGACIARIPAGSLRFRNGLRNLTMELFDTGGTKIAELGDLVSALVREPAALTRKPVAAPRRQRERFATILCELVSVRTGQPADRIDPRLGFHELGLDSAGMLDVVRQLGERLDTALSPTLLFEYPTVEQLSGWLERHIPAAPAPRPVPTPVSATEPVSESDPRPVAPPLDIAVVGLAGRYPQAYDLDAFWRNLRDGRDCVTSVPPQRWDWREYPTTARWGGFIDDVDCFDPLFFTISPREAAAMDPLERLFLEHCWIALEDAGYTRRGLREAWAQRPGRVGVFASVMFQEYSLLAAQALTRGRRLAVSGGGAAIANRVSHFCDLNGPSMTVDTACSGSLTALFLASRALRDGDVDAAFVGGVNLSIHPTKYLTLSEANFLSSKGRCEPFGEGGEGYIPAEGVGVLLLKRLRDAERDGDHVYGVVRGAAVNHGGRASGFTVPNSRAQGRVVEEALAQAGFDPRSVSYVEAHGTGTSLGDPIEIAGLARAFGPGGHGDGQVCAVGSVKSNIGHGEAVAGIAGVTKVLLQLRHRQLVPSLHARTPNPAIDFAATRFRVSQELLPWHRPTVDGHRYPRRAGVSSFGAGGSNAHVVIEEYVPGPRPATEPRPALIVLSARSPERLRVYAEAFADFLTTRRPSAVEQVRTELAAEVGRLLDVAAEGIAPDADWGEHGVDPVVGVRLVEWVERRLDQPAEPGLLQRCPSLASLAEHLCAEYGVRVEHGDGDASDPPTLAEIAYTTQVGREAHDERLALVVADLDQFAVELAHFLAGGASPRAHRGSVRSAEARGCRQLLDGEAGTCFLRALARDGDIVKLADLWVCGADVEWELLYAHGHPSRVSLPTYPFDRQRYWITDEPVPDGRAAPAEPGTDRVAQSVAAGGDRGGIHGLVAAAWEEVLGVDGVGPDDVFGDLGGDSIMAGRVIARLRAGFPFELELRGLFEARTVPEMARAVEAELIERIDELPDETVRSLASTNDQILHTTTTRDGHRA